MLLVSRRVLLPPALDRVARIGRCAGTTLDQLNEANYSNCEGGYGRQDDLRAASPSFLRTAFCTFVRRRESSSTAVGAAWASPRSCGASSRRRTSSQSNAVRLAPDLETKTGSPWRCCSRAVAIFGYANTRPLRASKSAGTPWLGMGEKFGVAGKSARTATNEVVIIWLCWNGSALRRGCQTQPLGAACVSKRSARIPI